MSDERIANHSTGFDSLHSGFPIHTAELIICPDGFDTAAGGLTNVHRRYAERADMLIRPYAMFPVDRHGVSPASMQANRHIHVQSSILSRGGHGETALHVPIVVDPRSAILYPLPSFCALATTASSRPLVAFRFD